MCRLYEFRSNALRKVECELIRSQNSLLAQSQRDERGEANPHGWGLATYNGALPDVVRQAEPASESEAFRWEAAKVHSCSVLAHVRRATIGRVEVVNTHPFTHGEWSFAHNGNLGAFEGLRPRLLNGMGELHQNAIQGDTDSEHVFHWLISLVEKERSETILKTVQRAILQLRQWSLQEDAEAEFALNIMLTRANHSIGCRFGRSLWYVERDLVHTCEVCDGAIHVDSGTRASSYRAVVVASEKVTQNEDWRPIPDCTLFEIDESIRLTLQPL